MYPGNWILIRWWCYNNINKNNNVKLADYFRGFGSFQTNTFQLVVVSDRRESFVLFLYPDTINWIQGEGKDSPQSNDPPAQAGFDHGDNTRYYTLPGSGMPQVNQLARSADCLTQWEGALTLWRPLLPYGYSYKASCAGQTGLSRHL